jgi:hypothetical protein
MVQINIYTFNAMPKMDQKFPISSKISLKFKYNYDKIIIGIGGTYITY